MKCVDSFIMCVSLFVTFHFLLRSIYWNEVWPTKSAGRTVGNTYRRVGWLFNRSYSRLEGFQWANVDLHVGCMAYETISLSYEESLHTHPFVLWSMFAVWLPNHARRSPCRIGVFRLFCMQIILERSILFELVQSFPSSRFVDLVLLEFSCLASGSVWPGVNSSIFQ